MTESLGPYITNDGTQAKRTPTRKYSMEDDVIISENVEGWQKRKRREDKHSGKTASAAKEIYRKEQEKFALLGFWPLHIDRYLQPADLIVLAVIAQSQEDPGCR